MSPARKRLRQEREYKDIQFIVAALQLRFPQRQSGEHLANASSTSPSEPLRGRRGGCEAAGDDDNGDITAEQAVIAHVGASFAEVISGFTAYYLGAKSPPSVTWAKSSSWAPGSDATEEAANAACSARWLR